MAWLSENLVLILTILLGLSETLAMIPAIKANSVFEMIVGALRQIKALVSPK
jgi:hypothetical protein